MRCLTVSVFNESTEVKVSTENLLERRGEAFSFIEWAKNETLGHSRPNVRQW